MTAPVIGFTAFHLGYKALSVNIQETKNVYKLSKKCANCSTFLKG